MLNPICIYSFKQPSIKNLIFTVDQSNSHAHVTQIYYDHDDFNLTSIVSQLFASDIELVTNHKPRITRSSQALNGNIVIIGTIGKSSILDEIMSNDEDIIQITGQWERFVIKIIQNPFPNVDQALVIAGSDRRGTAYGVLSVSEAIGVSPWYWWADIPVKKESHISIRVGNSISKAPSVKYRGIFLNDEDWGLHPWASKNIDTELNDIGPKTYAKVFELMLRLKANYMWPAMHECSGAFNKYDENRVVADAYGIIMGSAHCEPLLFNNATEWDKETMGEWNYKTNKSGILKQLDERVKSNAPYENLYTLALRGMHDEGMVGNLSQHEQLTILENAIADQRALLAKHIDQPIETIPQALIPYKEVMDIYEMGLQLPDEVTLIWPDDNYGYIKRLSTPEEQKRSGGSGVYYHVSYFGVPHNNLWMSTTPPNLMYEEMSKAYHTGADRVWILNVGDIKSCEYSTELFLDMAWDFDAFNYTSIYDHQAKWYSEIFGDQYKEDLREIWDGFYHQAFSRKPDYMGWGYEWNTDDNVQEVITDTEYSFYHYGEAEKRLSIYNDLSQKAWAIMSNLDEKYQPAFYQLVYYPIKGADLMNKKMLTAQKNRMYARQGRSKTNTLADLTIRYADSLKLITDQYNSLLNGKWSGMMSVEQGWFAAPHLMPPLDSIVVSPNSILAIYPEGEELNVGNSLPFFQLPTFNSFQPQTYFIDVVNKGSGILNWEANVSDQWVKISQASGKMKMEQRIYVSIDWDLLPKGENNYGQIEFSSGGESYKTLISTFKPSTISTDELKGLYVEQNGYVSIPAADFHRTSEIEGHNTIVINGLGIENKAIQFGDPLNRDRNPLTKSKASAEYDFYTFNSGWIKVYIYALPVFPLSPLESAEYAFTIDNDLTLRHDISAREYSQEWRENVLRNVTVTKSDVYLPKSGHHTFKLQGRTQGMVIQKVVIDMGGLKDSYLGPPSSKIE